MASRSDLPEFNRRKLLGMMGMGGAVGIAGCIGDDDDEVTPTPTPTPPDDIVEGGTLRYAVGENIDSFDPPYSLDTTSSFAQSLVFEGLTASGADGEIYPWLAQSFEMGEVQDVSVEDYEDYMIPIEDAEAAGDQMIWDLQTEDMTVTRETALDAVEDGVFGMEWHITLHEGVRFHNGDELTTEDVLASYDRYNNSMVDDQFWDSRLAVVVHNDYELTVYLTFPDPEGIRNFSVTVMHRDQANLPDADLDPRNGNDPIGTGPWTFQEFVDASHYVVTTNEDYWLDEKGIGALEWFDGPSDFPTSPVIDEIDMDLIPSDPTRAAALLNDEVDMTSVASDMLTQFDEAADFTVVSAPAGGYDYMQYPIQVEPWDDERIRQAANHLIPREIIANDIFEGWRTVAWHPPPSLALAAGTTDPEWLMDLTRPRNEFDPERADELMQEFADDTGVDTPVEVQLEFGPADNDDRASACELITESMNASGWFDVTLEGYEWGAYLARILTPEYWPRGHIYYVGLSSGQPFNPQGYVEANHHPTAVGGCCNANNVVYDDLTELMNEAGAGMQAMEDPAYRASLFDDIWDIVTDRAGSVYTVHTTNSRAMHRRVRGFEMHPSIPSVLSYGLWSPTDEVLAWIDPDA